MCRRDRKLPIILGLVTLVSTRLGVHGEPDHSPLSSTSFGEHDHEGYSDFVTNDGASNDASELSSRGTSQSPEDIPPLLLIGAGLPRTGTTSLVTALERLGLRSYNVQRMLQTPKHVELWYEYQVRRNLSLRELLIRLQDRDATRFNATFGLFNAHYRELLELYPDALVILTVRSGTDARDRWAESVSDTIARVPTMLQKIPFCWIPKLRKHAAVVLSHWQLIASTDRSTGQPIVSRLPHDYDDWNEEVVAQVPSDQLLVLPAGPTAWEPLCHFLSSKMKHHDIIARCEAVRAAREPYPHTNEGRYFRAAFLAARVIRVILCGGLVVAALYVMRKVGMASVWVRDSKVKSD